jgi:hypothetical protein
MFFGWLRRRRERKARIDADASTTIAKHGASAYWVARDSALEFRLHKVVDADRTPEYWDAVRFEIRRRQRHDALDTATRFLEDRR